MLWNAFLIHYTFSCPLTSFPVLQLISQSSSTIWTQGECHTLRKKIDMGTEDSPSKPQHILSNILSLSVGGQAPQEINSEMKISYKRFTGGTLESHLTGREGNRNGEQRWGRRSWAASLIPQGALRAGGSCRVVPPCTSHRPVTGCRLALKGV